MSVPKQRHTSSRRDRRRAGQGALKAKQSVQCANCGESTLSHRACPHCGTYRTRSVVGVAKKQKTVAQKK